MEKNSTDLTIKTFLFSMLLFLGSCSNNTSGWVSIEPEKIRDNAYSLFHHDWMALAAGTEGDMNAMTISWGSFGSLWGKPVITVYVAPERYTYEFMEKNEYFTVSAFDNSHREKLSYIGSHSGRDTNKIKDAGLTVGYTEFGNPFFNESRLLIECKKIYTQQFDSTYFSDIPRRVYQNGRGIHSMFIGEIVNVRIRN